jgi:hypothetical protein
MIFEYIYTWNDQDVNFGVSVGLTSSGPSIVI